MKPALIVLGVIVLLLVVVGMSGCGTYNSLVGSSQRVDAQWAQVQNVYQRRADLIPNLVQTVQGAANFEKSTLTEVTNARASVGRTTVNAGSAPADAAQLQQFEQAQGDLSRALSRLLVVSERYPELKSNQNFLSLQSQLEGTENRISVERGRFNEVVQGYNTQAQRFPGVVFARMFGFNPKPYFTAAPAAQTVPQVEFDFGRTPQTAPAGR
jgi:LemA protein